MRDGWTIHHNGPPARCVGREHRRCVVFWAAVKDFHVNGKGWSDIAYSFGVCPHGVRFEGRGWHRGQWANGADKVGADDGGDSHWYTVLAFVGGDGSTGDEEVNTPEMVAEIGQLIEDGRAAGLCGTRVLPHNAFKVKPCPGDGLTAQANAWNNKPINLELPTKDDDMPLTYAWFKDTRPATTSVTPVAGAHLYALQGKTAVHCTTKSFAADKDLAAFFGGKPVVWNSKTKPWTQADFLTGYHFVDGPLAGL